MSNRMITVRQRQWHAKLTGGDIMYRSADGRWTIIEGTRHFTLLDRGAAIEPCRFVSKEKCVLEAYRRIEIEAVKAS